MQYRGGGRALRRVRGAACSILALAMSVGPDRSALPAQPAPSTQMVASIPAAATVDHAAYDVLLRAHVVDGLVDYAAFARAPEFRRYLASLERVDLSRLDEDERLAFWINVYNAYTIQLIASEGETQSIRNIDKTLGVLRLKGPWSRPFVRAAGRVLTLDAVQHSILRAEFAEPRVHFALAYGALGSPPLRGEAYTGEKLEAQLHDQGYKFLRESPTQNAVDSMSVQLSPIFTYYRRDFASTRADLGRFLAPWFEGDQRRRLESGRFFERRTTFDWSLNIRGAKRATVRREPAPVSPAGKPTAAPEPAK